MKFLFITDTHATGRGPSSRIDNYMGAIEEKFVEVAQVIQEENIVAIFHGGDLFDKPVVSLSLTGQIADLIRATKVPWYVVPGNHDLFGYNIQSLPQTSLGLLSRTGVITILDRQYGLVVFTTPEGHTISFEGQEYHMDIDRRDPTLDYFTISNADKKILIPHSMLLNKEYFPDVPYTHVNQLKDITQADLILVGHFHDGFGPEIITHSDNRTTHILNPGSMTRDEASKVNLTRRPQYVIIEMDELTGELFYDVRPFQCAKPGTEIFDRSHITAKQQRNRYLQAFEQKLSDISLTAVDVRDVLDQIIQQDTSIDKEIATEARERLAEAEKALDDVTKQMTGYVEKPQNIYITKMVIKGFQSHEDTEIEFTNGLNAIIGPSNSGKSAIIRALRFVLYNEPKGSDFIRQSAKEVICRVEFSDGSYLERRRARSSAGSYIVGYPDGTKTELKGFTNNIPVDVPNTHQMPYIQLAKDLETTLNIGFQLEAPFMIGESPSTRAAIIGHLTGVHLVDTAIRELSKDITGNNRDMKTFHQQVEEIEEELQDFSDLPVMKQQIDEATRWIQTVEAKEQEKESYEKLYQEWQETVKAEREIQTQYAELKSIERLAPKVTQLEMKYQKLQELQSLLSKWQEATKEEATYQTELQGLLPLIQAHFLIQTLEKQVAEFAGLSSLQNDILNVMNQEQEILEEYHALPPAHTVKQAEAMESKWKQYQTLLELHEDLLHTRHEIVELRKGIKLAAIEEEQAKQEYVNILKEYGRCPTCQQEIREEVHIH